MFIERFYRRQNEAGGLGDTGGAGGNEGGEGTNGANTGGDGGNGGPPPAEYVGPEWAKEWTGVKDLGADILADPSLKVFNDPASLLKSYVHAQKQLGKKGVMIPADNAPKEEWDAFYQKVGVPLEEQKYIESAKLPKENTQFNEQFNTEFLKTAHSLRVQPSQAAKLYEFFNTQAKTTADKFMAETAEKTQAELNALRDEWGEDAYGVKITKAVSFLKEHAGEDFIKYLGESGLGKNAKLVRAFATMADKLLSEEKLPSGGDDKGMTAEDLQREINLAYTDKAYLDPAHPDNKRRVDEVLGYRRRLDKILEARKQ